MSQNKFVVIVLGLVIIAAAGLYALQRRSAPPASSPATPPAAARLTPADSTVMVKDQKPGTTVIANEVTAVEVAAYVVVHQDNGGVPGGIIGTSALLPPSSYRDVTVTLATPTVAERYYIAMLHQDDGDGVFNAATDTPLIDANNNLIVGRFEATEDTEMMEKEGGAAMPVPEEGVMVEKSTTHTIEMRESGFTPSALTVKKGDTVTFVNQRATPMWPASAVHPTHQVCPGFNALQGIEAGQSYSYTFQEAKECPFHDHLNVVLRGRITVTE